MQAVAEIHLRNNLIIRYNYTLYYKMEIVDADALPVREAAIEPPPPPPIKHGFITTYYGGDNVEQSIHTCGLFINGIPVGRHLTFHPSGTIEYVRTYGSSGFLTGLWEHYDLHGRILLRAMYDDDVMPHGVMSAYRYSTEFRTRVDSTYWEHGLPATHYEIKTAYNVDLILNMGNDLYMHIHEHIGGHKFGNRTSNVDITLMKKASGETDQADEADIYMWFQSIHPSSPLFTVSTRGPAEPPKKSLGFKSLMRQTHVPMHCGPLYEYICRKAVKEFDQFRGRSADVAELIDAYNVFISNYIKGG
jgi:hypothetical protein